MIQPKYRAWDKQHKIMVAVNMILFFSDEIDFDGHLGEPKSMLNFDLMPYIGLNDRCKQEIYENDIIHVDCSGVGGAFNDGHYVVQYSLPDCAFYLVTLDGAHSISFNECYDYQIIGNIYEWPKI